MSISNVDGGHFEIQDGLIGASRHLLHARSFIKTNIASETNQKSLKASKTYTIISYNTDARKPLAFSYLMDLFSAESLSSFRPSVLIYTYKPTNGQQRQRNLLRSGARAEKKKRQTSKLTYLYFRQFFLPCACCDTGCAGRRPCTTGRRQCG